MTPGIEPALICSEGTALQRQALAKPTHIISIHDPGDERLLYPSESNVLYLSFADFFWPSHHSASKSHIEKALDFCSDLEMPRNLLVNCVYGQSRSAAIALGISCQFFESTQELTDAFSPHYLRISPNSYVIDLFKTFLSIDKMLILRETAKHFND